MLITVLLCTFMSWSQEVHLQTVEIESDLDALTTSRSVEWPVRKEQPLPAINLPQPDDTLNGFNGLQVRTQGSPTFSIRGSAQNGRALLLYDHIPLNFASGVGAPRIFLAKENLEQVLLVKGPASLFYGSQAMAGAVDLIPRRYKEPEININISDTNESFLPWREGDVGHQSYQFATPLYQSEDTHIQTSLFYEDDDGLFPFQTENQSGERDFNAQNLSRATLSSETRWEAVHLKFNALGGRQVLQSPGPINFSLPTRQESEGGLLSITPHVFFSDDMSLRSRVSFLKNDWTFLESGVETYTNSETLIFQNEWIYDVGRFTKIQFFGDFFSHELDSSFAGDNLTQDNTELGPFLSFHIFDAFKHQLGGRYLTNNARFLPTASTHWLNSISEVWISYSQGFRNPTVFDLFADNPNFIGNPNLEAESSEQYELGFKNTPSQKGFVWDFRLFHTEYTEFIETLEATPGVFTRDNQGSGYARGFDVDLGWENPFYGASLDYNYLDTKNRSQARAFRLSPRHQISLNSFYRYQDWMFQIQNIHWYDAIDVSLNQPVELRDWQQWNFYLQWQVFKKTRLSFGMVNAFNEAKELTLNYPEPQRKYWLQWQQRF